MLKRVRRQALVGFLARPDQRVAGYEVGNRLFFMKYTLDGMGNLVPSPMASTPQIFEDGKPYFCPDHRLEGMCNLSIKMFLADKQLEFTGPEVVLYVNRCQKWIKMLAQLVDTYVFCLAGFKKRRRTFHA